MKFRKFLNELLKQESIEEFFHDLKQGASVMIGAGFITPTFQKNFTFELISMTLVGAGIILYVFAKFGKVLNISLRSK